VIAIPKYRVPYYWVERYNDDIDVEADSIDEAIETVNRMIRCGEIDTDDCGYFAYTVDMVVIEDGVKEIGE